MKVSLPKLGRAATSSPRGLAIPVVVVAEAVEVGAWAVVTGAEVIAAGAQAVRREINSSVIIKVTMGLNTVPGSFNSGEIFILGIFLIPPQISTGYN
jgi:hypothetical protein